MDVTQFSAVCFIIVHPVLGILDRKVYHDRCNAYWENPATDVVFGSIVSGILALGSFFCVTRGHPEELELVHYAKGVLGDPRNIRHPSMDQVAAWILRTIYLSATTRPNASWLASCNIMHLAVATGLHREIGITKRVGVCSG